MDAAAALKVLFLGTGSFAEPAFDALLQSRNAVVGLVTQPDRGGPGRHHHEPPLKAAAVAAGLPVLQPENINAPESLDRLREFTADLYVVAAYGQMLKRDLLSIPRYGAVNLHASLLPRHRGAAPVHYAILSGDAETGVTVFQIERRLDAGPILGMVRTAIGPRETTGDLEPRLARLAAELILDVADRIAAGTATPVPQDDAFATLAPRMPKSFGEIDWTRTSAEIERKVRALQPWPKAYSFLQAGEGPPLRLTLLDVAPLPGFAADAQPGEVIASGPGELRIRTGDGALAVERLQPAGKRDMVIAEFLRGRAVPPGSRFCGDRASTSKPSGERDSE
ncbi:MAG: methionyl-tRNA formyltransferase [Planctomyces sp.]|nr:methionyl-tRNA formyltransferase [Planctomyces sp.]